MSKLFSINLAYIKHHNKLDIKDLVEIIGLTSSTVSNLLNNKTIPNAETLLKLSQRFNYSIDDMLKVDLEKKDQNTYYVGNELDTYTEIEKPIGFTPKGKIIKKNTPIEDAIVQCVNNIVNQKNEVLIKRIAKLEFLLDINEEIADVKKDKEKKS